MEAKVIIVSIVKSNKSENNVWAVGITGEEQEQAYCKSAYKAMRFAFLLKKQTGFYIDDDSLKMLSEEIAKQKAEAAAQAEQEPQPEVPAEEAAEVQQPEAEAKPKKGRKPRAKKAQAQPEAEAAIAPIAQTAELLAFV